MADAWIDLHRSRAVHDNVVFGDRNYPRTDSGLEAFLRAGSVADQRCAAWVCDRRVAFKPGESPGSRFIAQADGSECGDRSFSEPVPPLGSVGPMAFVGAFCNRDCAGRCLSTSSEADFNLVCAWARNGSWPGYCGTDAGLRPASSCAISDGPR